MKRSKASLFLILSLILAFCPSGLFGDVKDSLVFSAKASMFVITADNPIAKADPMPVTVSLGASLAYAFFDNFLLETSLDFYGTMYGFPDKPDSLAWPVPYAIENRSTLVLGTLAGIYGVGRFRLTDKVWLRVYGGPGADLRLCLIANDLKGSDKEEASAETSRTTTYFWGKGRWFFPVAGAGMDFAALEKLRLGFDFRVWFPVYKFWTKENLPGMEGWRFAAGLRITPVWGSR